MAKTSKSDFKKLLVSNRKNENALARQIKYLKWATRRMALDEDDQEHISILQSNLSLFKRAARYNQGEFMRLKKEYRIKFMRKSLLEKWLGDESRIAAIIKWRRAVTKWKVDYKIVSNEIKFLKDTLRHKNNNAIRDVNEQSAYARLEGQEGCCASCSTDH